MQESVTSPDQDKTPELKRGEFFCHKCKKVVPLADHSVHQKTGCRQL